MAVWLPFFIAGTREANTQGCVKISGSTAGRLPAPCSKDSAAMSGHSRGEKLEPHSVGSQRSADAQPAAGYDRSWRYTGRSGIAAGKISDIHHCTLLRCGHGGGRVRRCQVLMHLHDAPLPSCQKETPILRKTPSRFHCGLLKMNTTREQESKSHRGSPVSLLEVLLHYPQSLFGMIDREQPNGIHDVALVNVKIWIHRQ